MGLEHKQNSEALDRQDMKCSDLNQLGVELPSPMMVACNFPWN